MERRTAGILIGILVLVCCGLALSVLYPFTTSAPHAAKPPGEQFSAGSPEAFSATGSIVVDGEEQLAFDGVVTPEGGWYQRVSEANVTSEEYRPPSGGPIYERLVVVGRQRAERLREGVVEDEDRELLRATRSGDRSTFVIENDAAGDTQPVSGTASVFIASLAVAGYDEGGTGSSPDTTYEPRAGWYEGAEAYRITDASGAVRVDPDGPVVTSANVTWDVTAPAGSYAEYALVRLTGDDPTTHRITFERNPDGSDLERPSWVDDTDPG